MFEHIVVVLRSRTLICNSYCYVVQTADLFEFVFLEKKKSMPPGCSCQGEKT